MGRWSVFGKKADIETQPSNFPPPDVYVIRMTLFKNGAMLCYQEEIQRDPRSGLLQGNCIDDQGIRHSFRANYNYGQI